MKLHKATNRWGCGPGILRVLLGGGTRKWGQKIMEYRKTHKPVGFEKGDSVWRNAQWSFNNEILAMLNRTIHRRLKFKFLRKEIDLRNFINKLSKNKTFLISLENHFCVVQNGFLFDNSQNEVSIDNFRFDRDIVEAYLEVPGVEICTVPKSKPRPEISEVLANAYSHHHSCTYTPSIFWGWNSSN